MLVQTPKPNLNVGPLIKIPKLRWERDPGISELIDHFDHPDRYRKPEKLTPSEWRVILKETEACRDNFAYAAKNYFWIEDKETRQDKLFSLWESQELILDELNKIRAKGISQRIMIIKARQLGCSTVIEGLIAWRTFFYTNINALVVSYNDQHAAYLFSLAQKIYDKLPWWLQPECSSREFQKGLILDRKDYEERRLAPGLNSKIVASGANSITSVGRGYRLSAAHLSEYALWTDSSARDIIEGDVKNALSDGPETFAFLESTANGAGRYAHDLWVRMEKLAERSEWTPVFLPWFFDRSHRVVVPMGWNPRREEKDMREKITRDWVRCDSAVCRQFYRRKVQGREYTDTTCAACGIGTLKVFNISNEQLAWMEKRRENVENDEESLNKLREEQATTAEEAFVVSGVKLFSDTSVTFAERCCDHEPETIGYVDKKLSYHAHDMKSGKCVQDGCGMDHSFDEQALLRVYVYPEPGETYWIGGDVGEGIGQDFSALQVLKINKFGGPDEQVATWASNKVDPIGFAEAAVRIGFFYNTATLVIEVNKYDTAETWVRIQLNYPNVYRAKAVQNENMQGTKRYGWLTTANTKPRLYHTLRKKLETRLIYIRDKFTVGELKMFRKDDDSSSTGAAVGHDDLIMALMIALYTAHELDWDETHNTIRVKIPLTLETAPIIFKCTNGHEWPASGGTEYRRCPECQTMLIESRVNSDESARIKEDPDDDLMRFDDEQDSQILEYDLL